MMPISLQPIPGYRTQFVADGQNYDIRIKALDDLPVMDVTRNGTLIASSLPCLIGQTVLPYRYMEGDGGNFVWSTASGNNPQFPLFGTQDILLYATAAEMASIRAGA